MDQLAQGAAQGPYLWAQLSSGMAQTAFENWCSLEVMEGFSDPDLKYTRVVQYGTLSAAGRG